MADALFTREGELYKPSELTEGPWSPDAQHGGPPAALLAGAIEREPSQNQMVLARVSVELLRPVPLEPLQLVTEVVRPGRRVQLVSATLTHDGTEVAHAVGLRIRRAELELPFHQPDEKFPPPSAGRPASFFASVGAFASEAMEIRMIEGDIAEPGPGRGWLRLRYPVLEGLEPTGVERVAAAADFTNGFSNLAGKERSWAFINPDLVIRLARPPVGEWIYLDAHTLITEVGVGVASGILADDEGRLGVATQSLFVEPLPHGR